MSYLVFARKYRPQTFEDVVQQSHVTHTLANAIVAERVAHAILFSGPRGTGKTTIARILAKAMNCEAGPTATPCNRCQSCVEITAGHSADVFEIDGASNNSVDQVRELRENIKYMPVNSRYKIYIIDEVHMLSLAAFNALLKTLEEPPEHILFLFATTEIHKIPITILSRCQRHDLRRIDATAITKHLQDICASERVEIDEESLGLIAQESGGSMRDSLSLLDHVLACAQGPVTVRLISELLGIVDRKHFLNISEAVFQSDIQKVLEAIDAVWRDGYEIKRFYTDLVAHFHNLAVIKLGPRAGRLVDLPQHEIDHLKAHIKEVSDSYLLQIFDLLYQAEPAMKHSSQPKIGLEMVFLKLFQTAPALPIDSLIDHIDQLQSRLGAGHQLVSEAASDPSPSKDEDSIPQDPERPAEESSPHDLDTPGAFDALWKEVIERISNHKPSLGGFLAKCELRSGKSGEFDLVVNGNEFIFKNIAKHKQSIEDQCCACLKKSVNLNIVPNFEDRTTKQEQKKKISRLKQQAMSHPLVMEAIELFDGRVIDVKVQQEE